MTVRAKFKVDTIERAIISVAVKDADGKPVLDGKGYTKYEPGEVRTVKLSPVYTNGDPNHENSKFWAASPSGQVTLGCANLSAADYFELGGEYYLDFTKAP